LIQIHGFDRGAFSKKRLYFTYLRHKERFVKCQPKAKKLAKEVWINPPRAVNNQEDVALKAKKFAGMNS
jgi:hypothetical protein